MLHAADSDILHAADSDTLHAADSDMLHGSGLQLRDTPKHRHASARAPSESHPSLEGPYPSRIRVSSAATETLR